MRVRAGSPRVWGPCLALGLVLIAVASVLLATRAAPPRAQAIPLVNIGRVPGETSTSTRPVTQRPVTHRTDPGSPIPTGSHLAVSRLGVDALITNVRLNGTVMQVPRDPRTVGWWSAGARPGSAAGSVVIVGHINYAGTSGALSVLPRARTGDPIDLVEPNRTLRYRIVAVHSYPKTSGLPASAFRRTGPPQLVLITCGGAFDASTGNYLDNIVAFAEPV